MRCVLKSPRGGCSMITKSLLVKIRPSNQSFTIYTGVNISLMFNKSLDYNNKRLVLIWRNGFSINHLNGLDLQYSTKIRGRVLKHCAPLGCRSQISQPSGFLYVNGLLINPDCVYCIPMNSSIVHFTTSHLTRAIQKKFGISLNSLSATNICVPSLPEANKRSTIIVYHCS